MKDNFFKKSQVNLRNTKSQHKNRVGDDKLISNSNSNNFFIKSNIPHTSKESKTEDNNSQKSVKADKKPFDKKKYRLQKYSKKYQIQQWEDKRKKAILRNYYKSVKEDELIISPNKVHKDQTSDIDKKNDDSSSENHINETTSNKVVGSTDDPPKNSKETKSRSFKKAQQEFQRIKDEKAQKKESLMKKKIEREDALQAYKKKKIEKHKRLNKKNKKGQPIMKGRLEMLLEKIQSNLNN